MLATQRMPARETRTVGLDPLDRGRLRLGPKAGNGSELFFQWLVGSRTAVQEFDGRFDGRSLSARHDDGG